ncbi:ABC transporter permease [Aquincola sp. J276]|uniref:ABC transporter permease n=1 Tax=Aquincola sp. J276 TaxID=2898432 RepID=UPI0021518A27|nr:ABC transporter permease [Aquincola sp. J276]MCR5869114.1 ABC transporter permease [Aquincola sp. J276]
MTTLVPQAAAPTHPARAAARLRSAAALLLRKPALLVGSLMLLALAAVALFGRFWFSADPWDMAGPPMLWPGEDAAYPLGTDLMGRDIVTGLVSGARVSLLVGLVSTALSAVLGVAIGALGGFYRGWVDALLGRVTEVFQTVPKFVLAVVLVALFKPSIATEVIAIGIVSWPATARLVRAEFLRLREREFVLAAETLGMGDLRLMLTQILPNALPSIVVVSTLTIANAIQTEAALAFLGLGDPNVMSWGTIIGAGREQVVDAWFICALPGAAIVVAVLGFNLVGEGLSDAMNPQLQRRVQP